MSEKTSHLELFKYNPNTDGDQTFNIDNCLNDNMDIIDEFAGDVDETLENLGDNKANVSLNNLDTIGQAIIDSKADKEFTYNNFKRLDEGENLEVKFSDEIANYSDKYAWLKARKDAGNYEGINIGDYFYTSIKAGTIAGYSIAAQTFKCRIIGINTYKGCGSPEIGNMFYISSDEVINTPFLWNPNNNNNGTSVEDNPWRASAMFAILNGGNNSTTKAYNNVSHGANGGNGVISLLPSELQAVLVDKMDWLDQRYSASGLLTGGTNWKAGYRGKLWLPTETEVYGCGVRSNLCLTSGFWWPENGLSIQFPWFANNCEHRVKRDSNNIRRHWWLSAPASGNSTHVCSVNGRGAAHSDHATHSDVYAPLCFCI